MLIKEETEKQLKDLKDLLDDIQYIIDSPIWSEEEKYEKIFSENVSKKVFSLFREIGTKLDYYDPDSSCQEDYMAFYQAFQEKMNQMLK